MKWPIQASAFLVAIVVMSTASYAQFNQALMLSIRGARLDGVCGSANGVSTATAPTSNLCSAGVASSVTGSGPWNWTCNGTGGGTTASCSAPPPGGGVPGPAQAAGFTTLAINMNFDTDSSLQDPNNWFECSYGNGGVTYHASNPIFWQGWTGFGNGAPCSHTTVSADPVFGNTVLGQQWGNNDFNSNDGNAPGVLMQTTSHDYSSGRVFTNYYFEVVGRWDNNELQGNTAWWTYGNFGSSPISPGSAVIENDMVERYGTGVGHNTHNFVGCGGDCGGGIGVTNISDFNYHRWAGRVTGVLGGEIDVCWYFEDTPDVSGLNLLGCQFYQGQTSNQQNGLDRSDGIIFSTGPSQTWTGCSPSVGGGGPFADRCLLQTNGGSLTSYVKRFRVYVCPAYTPNQNPSGGAQQCFTSSPNP